MLYLPWLMGTYAALLVNGQAFSTPSGSNVPTLEIGDYVFAAYTKPGALPERGAMIYFNVWQEEGRVIYVKRVLGLPGDRISFRDGMPILNRRALIHVEVGKTKMPPLGGPSVSARLYTETLPGGVSYTIARIEGAHPPDTAGEVTVPPGKLFVLGDNRDDSLDSRSREFGLVDLRDVVAQGGVVYWSSDPARLFIVIR